MLSLVFYIVSFTVIIGIVSSITIFFNNNIRDLNGTVTTSSEYNKFNLYMLEYTKNGYTPSVSNENTVVIFSKNNNDSVKFTFLSNTLYFNKIKLCENVNDANFEIVTAANGKLVLRTIIDINGIEYDTDYVIE